MFEKRNFKSDKPTKKYYFVFKNKTTYDVDIFYTYIFVNLHTYFLLQFGMERIKLKVQKKRVYELEN